MRNYYTNPAVASISLPLPQEGIDLAEQVIGPPKTPSYKPQYGEFNFDGDLWNSPTNDIKIQNSISAGAQANVNLLAGQDQTAYCYMPPNHDLSDDDEKEILEVHLPKLPLVTAAKKKGTLRSLEFNQELSEFDIQLSSQANSYPKVDAVHSSYRKGSGQEDIWGEFIQKPVLKRLRSDDGPVLKSGSCPENFVGEHNIESEDLENAVPDVEKPSSEASSEHYPSQKKRDIKSASKLSSSAKSSQKPQQGLPSSESKLDSKMESSSRNQGSHQQNPPKSVPKGRNRENDVSYLEKGYTELEEKVAEVQNDSREGIPFSATKKKWNLISALRVRLRDREHALQFEQLFDLKDRQSQILLSALEEVATPEQLAVISEKTRRQWKKSEEEAPKLQELRITEHGAKVNGLQRPCPVENGCKLPNIPDTQASALDDPSSSLRNLMEEQFAQTANMTRYFQRNKESSG